MSNLVSPLLFSMIPFKDPDSWTDYLFVHQQWLSMLAQATGVSMPTRLLDDLRTNLEPHGKMHDQLADALKLPHVGDWVSYDLQDEPSFQTFVLLCSQDTQRLRTAAGL